MDAPEEQRGTASPFDTALLKQRRAQGRCGPDFLLALAGEELLARLREAHEHLLRKGEHLPPGPALVCGPAALARQVAHALPERPVMQGHWLAPCMVSDELPQVVLDHEHLPLNDGSIAFALVLFDFAFVNDLPRALRAWWRVLRPGGLLLTALPGGETLRELRAAWATAEQALAQQRGESFTQPGWRIAPFLEVRQLATLAGMAGFQQVITDTERLRARYADALSLMRELKQGGWANPLRPRPRRPVSRHLLGLAAAHYELAHAEDDGRLPATFELLYLTARRPAAPDATS